MSKNGDFYFQNFIESSAISLETSEMLLEILDKFGVNLLAAQVKQIHEIENRGDEKRHILLNKIIKDFMTPLERDDIIKLSNAIDDITDSIEDIAINIYIDNETSIRPDALIFAKLDVKICQKVKLLMEELQNFKKSKTLADMVKEIHSIEEGGDALYMQSMKTLFADVTQPIRVIAWKDIYGLFEKCCDTCADVADIVEGIAISNI